MRVRGLGQGLGSPLLRQSAFAGVAVFVPQLVGMVTIPLLTLRLGTAAYGVWALVGSLIVVFMTFDGGISVSAQRFYALYAAQERRALAGRLTFSLVLAVSLFGGGLWLVGPWVARAVVGIASIPERYHADAVLLFRHIGILVGLLLLANVFTGYLRARGHFGRIAAAITCSQAAFLGTILWFGKGLSLGDMLTVSLAQLGTLALALAAGMAPHLVRTPFKPLPGPELRSFVGYANRSLVTNISSLALLQAGPIVVAWQAPIDEVGYLSIATMLASAIRSLPMFAVTPLLNRLTAAHGSAGEPAAVDLGSRVNRLWTPLVVGYIAACAAGAWFVVRGFTGEQPITSAAAVVLILAYGLNLSTGMTTATCRAVGRPGLEARYSLVLTVGLLAILAPAAAYGGAVAVAVANLLAQGVAVVYFARILGPALPELSLGWRSVRWPSVVVTSFVAAGLGALSLWLAPRSALTLAATGLAVAVALVVYLAWNAQLRAGARALTRT